MTEVTKLTCNVMLLRHKTQALINYEFDSTKTVEYSEGLVEASQFNGYTGRW